MNWSSFAVIVLGVVNLLLITAGVLMSYFDWSAARKREFLYLYFTEERPGSSFFYAAKRRRGQVSRLLLGFSLLLLRQLLSSWLMIVVSAGAMNEYWHKWWQTGTSHPDLDGILRLYPWIYWLEICGLALLAFGVLYPARAERTSRHDLFNIITLVVWTIFSFVIILGFFGDDSVFVARDSALVMRTLICALAVWGLLRRGKGEDSRAEGLLTLSSFWMLLTFLLWWTGQSLTLLFKDPIAAPILSLVAFMPLLVGMARNVMSQYEGVESSRHRMGRERAVMFSFLQRIGNAFSSAVELEQILDIVLDSSLKTTEASAGAIYLYQRKTNTLEPSLVNAFFPPLYVDTPAASSEHRTEDLEEEMKHQSFALGEGIIGEVAQSGRAQLVMDVAADGIMVGTTTEYMRNRSMLVVPLRVRDEPLGVLAVLNKQRGSFSREDQSLLQSLADQGALSIQYAVLTNEARQQERLRRELQIARDIQKHLLPDKCPAVKGFEIAGRATSATEVGGDYYDFMQIDDDHLGIVLADVSGKGVHAALVVAMIRSAFRTQARNTTDVRQVLGGVNDFITQDLPENMFITCVYGVLEVSTRTFTWARAGHEPLILAHLNAPCELMSPDGFALGVIEGAEFLDLLEVETIHLASGDRILMFSDGLTEAMNNDGEEFGMERVLEILAPHPERNGHSQNGHSKNGNLPQPNLDEKSSDKNGGTLDEARDTQPMSPCAPDLPEVSPDDLMEIESAVATHVGDAEQSDDLTMVYLAAT